MCHKVRGRRDTSRSTWYVILDINSDTNTLMHSHVTVVLPVYATWGYDLTMTNEEQPADIRREWRECYLHCRPC